MRPAIAPKIRRVPTPEVAEYADIHSIPLPQAPQRARPTLLPEEAAVSLPEPDNVPTVEIQMLNRMLGPALTVENPVWSGDPIPRMRALQKALVEHSLSLPEGDRSDCLDAITLVEKAVQLRLRWLQMRRSDAELDPKPLGMEEEE
jgi:hypothetical protein